MHVRTSTKSGLHRAGQHVDAADRLVRALVERFRVLASQPGLGRNRADLAADLRSSSSSRSKGLPTPVRVTRLTASESSMDFRHATQLDAGLLAALNEQLIQDEGHRIQLTRAELEQRMREWLGHDYEAVLFNQHGNAVAHAPHQERPEEVYLRQFFVVRDRRRRRLGRKAPRSCVPRSGPPTSA